MRLAWSPILYGIQAIWWSRIGRHIRHTATASYSSAHKGSVSERFPMNQEKISTAIVNYCCDTFATKLASFSPGRSAFDWTENSPRRKRFTLVLYAKRHYSEMEWLCCYCKHAACRRSSAAAAVVSTKCHALASTSGLQKKKKLHCSAFGCIRAVQHQDHHEAMHVTVTSAVPEL